MPQDQTTYHDVQDRYHNDPHFRALVKTILGFAIQHKYTPSELRDASFIAAMEFESVHCRQSHTVYPGSNDYILPPNT